MTKDFFRKLDKPRESQYFNTDNKFRSKIVKLLIFDGETQIRDFTINLSRTDRRNFFNQIVDWAITNGKFVEIQHVEDYRDELTRISQHSATSIS